CDRRRAARTVSLLCLGRTAKHGGFVRAQGGGVNLKRTLGLDILSERYAYEHDPAHGWVSSSRVADRWVPTTCGYCSVGCGILIGVKENRAVAVRGNPEHPVNRGKLCPKGLSEHHTLAAKTRAQYPLLRKDGKLARVSWNEALDTMVTRF